MASGRVLLAVFVSLIAAVIAGDGTACSTDPTTGLYSIQSNFFETLSVATPATESVSVTAHAITNTVNNVPINNFKKGTCQSWGKGTIATGTPPPQYISWAEWDLSSFAITRRVDAFLQLTEPHDGKAFSTRLTVVWMKGSDVSTSAGCSNTNVDANWECLAFIQDSCQGYGNSTERVYTFWGGNRYFFIFDSPEVATTFKLTFHSRNGMIGRQDWEGFGSLTEEALSGNPGSWQRSTPLRWAVYPVHDYKIGIPGWSSTNWPAPWTGLKAGTDLVGQLGQKIIMNMPSHIWGQTYAGGFTEDDVGGRTCANTPNDPSCTLNQVDTLTSPAYSGLVSGTSYDLEVEYFWYDGRTETNTVASGTAKVYAAPDRVNGPWTEIKIMDNVVDNNWAVERIAIPVEAISVTGQVYFRFTLQSTDLKLGWAMNGIQVVPHFKYDQCDDGFTCSKDKCSNRYTFPVGNPTTKTNEAYGCFNPSDESTCEGLNSATKCKTWACEPTDLSNDEAGCVGTDKLEGEAGHCDDSHDCATVTCDGDGVCQYAKNGAHTCADGKGCTVDSCLIPEDDNYDKVDEHGCYYEASCDDHVMCTTDTCEEAALGGDKCLHTIDFNICEDNIDCTYELVCDPEQPGMDPISGCIRIPMDEWCDDGKACTIDTCEPLTEAEEGMEAGDRCFHREIDCDDCIQCTRDSCEEGECVNEADDNLCDDGIPCTDDVCNKELGKCQNIPMDSWCYNDRALTGCEVFECRPYQVDEAAEGEAAILASNSDEAGCIQVQKDCDDDLACTEDYCDEGKCHNEAVNSECIDEGECTVDTCDKKLGKCLNLPDSSLCHDEAGLCTVKFCGRDGNCHFPAVDCSDDIYCTDDSCDPDEGCQHEANTEHCRDAFDCTDDLCDTNLGGCTNLPNHGYCADNHSPCYTWACNVASEEAEADGCLALIKKDCDDGIPCTVDTCDEATGDCNNEADNEACFIDGKECYNSVCDNVLGCLHTPTNAMCDDSKKCTIDTCGCDGMCDYTPIVCDDNIACTDDFCDEATGKCDITIDEAACDDDIACTADECDLDLGRCTNIEKDSDCVSSADGCYVSECSIEHKGCVGTAHHEMCDDHIPCTYDYCDGVNGCVHEAMDSLCNDGIDCTYDTCSTADMGCVFTAIDERCDDYSNCTTHSCSVTAGCVIVPNHSDCNDDIECTEDVCNSPDGVPSGCSFIPKNSWCDDGVGCTEDSCDATEGCKNEPVHSYCDDGWDCTEAGAGQYCDATAGCIYDDSNCPWHVEQDPLCLECTTSSAQILQLNYTDGTGAMQFATRDAETDELKTNFVALPTDQVIIGGASQAEVRVGKDDGLVINDNLRLVPLDQDEEVPVCNEIRRGSIIVVPVATACGEHTCHRDTVKVCSKQQDYEWVSLN